MAAPFELTGGLFRTIQLRIGIALGVASDGDELPFFVHLAILIKVYRMTLRLHSARSLSPLALPSTSVRKSSSAGVLGGMDSGISASMSARKSEIFCK